MSAKKLVSLIALFAIAVLTSGSSCDEGGPGLISGNSGSFEPGSRTSLDRNQNGNQNGDADRGEPLRNDNCDTSCGSGESCVEGACVPTGSLNIVLVWESELDLDLHVRTPAGEELYYRNRTGEQGGRFLKDGCIEDNCDGNESRIETVLWGQTYPQGTFDIWAVNYDGGEAASFRIEVTQDGEIKDTFSGQVGAGQGERSSSFSVCIGQDVNDDSCSTQQRGCFAELDRLGVSYRTWGYSTESVGGQQCTVSDPIIVDGRINGVDFQYYQQSSPTTMRMGCELAVALYHKADVLKRHGIRAAGHNGTFQCRFISGTTTLSNHAHGLGIDIVNYIGNDGTVYSLKGDWEHETSSPSTAKAAKLYNIAQDLHSGRVFNTILTPNYNSDHDDHFHFDVNGGGGNFLGYVYQEYYIGSDRGHLCSGH